MDLRESSLGFYRVWHAALGARHGLFERLVAWRTPGQLARASGLAPGPLATWCRGAWALGLLERDGARYRVPPALRGALATPASAEDMGHHFDYLARKSLGFGALDEMLAGRPARAALADVYAVATSWDHAAFFDLALPRQPALGAALRRGIDVLDLGAGAGGWTREAARRFPRSRFVATDLDAKEVAKARRALRGFPNARAAREAAAGAFDLVFLGEVLAAAPDPRAPLAAAHRALREGGRLVALEGLRPPEERAPRGWGERLVLAMALDFGLDGSRFLSLAEAREALRERGFGRIAARDLGGSLFALTAVKRRASSARRRLSPR